MALNFHELTVLWRCLMIILRKTNRPYLKRDCKPFLIYSYCKHSSNQIGSRFNLVFISIVRFDFDSLQFVEVNTRLFLDNRHWLAISKQIRFNQNDISNEYWSAYFQSVVHWSNIDKFLNASDNFMMNDFNSCFHDR